MGKSRFGILRKSGMMGLALLIFLMVGCASQSKTAEVEMKYEDIAGDLSAITVESMEEKAVVIESLWSDRRIVLVFIRHFG